MSGMFGFSVSARAMFAAVLFMALLSAALASPAWAQETFVVNSTGDGADADTADGVCDADAAADGGQCTLRAAIEQANATTGPDEIRFGISGGGPHTISPAMSLPTIIDPVVIDGYTQNGSTTATADAATLKIEVEGSAGGGENGITIGSGGGGSTVRGLVVNRFSSAGIHILSDGNTVEGNHIGTNVAGDEGLPNGFVGVLIDGGLDTAESASNDNVIGGATAAARNVISGNATHGVWIRGTFDKADSASGNVVLGNYIGTDATGTERLANGDPGNGFGNSSGSGVEITLGIGNTIGGTDEGARNILSGNGQYGVRIALRSSNNEVLGNYIGADVSGTDSITNERDGVRIEGGSSGNVIGGTDEGAGNLISGNNSNSSFLAVSNPNTGVTIRDATTTGNKVQGNFIGTDKDGAAPLGNSERNEPDRVFFTGNGQFGVRILNAPGNIIGGTDADDGAVDGDVKARNVISGNRGVTQQNGVTGTGLKIEGPNATGNKVQGNYIGTDVSGTEAVRNILDGVVIEDATNNTIGGAEEGARNVISGNLYDGIAIHEKFEDTSGNKVQGNYIGVDATGGVALPNATGAGIPSAGVTVTAPGNIIGGTEDGEGNVISGNGEAGVVEGGGNGIIIVAPDTDPDAASGNVIQGNFIGTDATGETALKNGRCGIAIRATDTIVGGAEDGAGNVISANHNDGIEIIGEASSGNEIQGNRFGTDVSGTEDLGNGGSGVDIIGATDNTVGGIAEGAGNLLSANGLSGVEISGETASGNVVQGNFAGTDAEGTQALGNGFFGVFIEDASDNIVGGTDAGAGNLLSGNTADGIQIFGEAASGNVVQGNLIGTDVSGTQALGNLLAGASVAGGSDNIIGGAENGAGNVISANVQEGVFIAREAASGNEVLGNLIGTDETGTDDMGNGRDGIRIADSAGGDNAIGGAEEVSRNVIAFSGEVGVRLETAGSGNAILRNSIFSNGGLGIDLGEEGVTPNDVKDPDTGPNKLQNHPAISGASIPEDSTAGGSTTVAGSLDSVPGKTFVLRFFSNLDADASGFGEGKTFLGQKSVTTDSSGLASFNSDFTGALPAGEFVSATATDPNGNTSEFSNARMVLADETTTEELGTGTLQEDRTVSTGSTVSEANPASTSVKIPAGTTITNENRTVSITESSTAEQSEPSGFSFLGYEIGITAPDATPGNPLELTFLLDESLLPEGMDAGSIEVFKNGARVSDCADDSGEADPDPCVSVRGDLEGSIRIVVLTSSASVWNFGMEAEDRGPGDPDNPKNPKACTIKGTPGNDMLRGTPGRDVICGLGGNDTIRGFGGNDRILGGPGNDTIFGQGGSDTAFGGAGNDTILGGAGPDAILGGAGNDELFGQAGVDELFGQGGADLLNVRDGAPRDLANGGPGSDRCAADAGDRRVSCER